MEPSEFNVTKYLKSEENQISLEVYRYSDCLLYTSLVMDAALPLYKNLYTMHKYNGESLTTYEPRGPWSKIHTDLS